MRIPLGPFELHKRLARGGMGYIWRGEHVAQQLPVAIKVVTAPREREEEYIASFKREVQATVRLNHPGIVMVLDYGIIPPESAALSEGMLTAGNPYLAMEFASGGSLDHYEPPERWHDLRRILFTLLDALGHAHARGVLHRDLKPGNILLCTDDDLRPGFKVTDFGISHAADALSPSGNDAVTANTEELPSGTPYYMAPEQFRGRWRDYGPWTDLYSLGIMTYELACGKLPFDGDSFLDLGLRHLKNEMPPLEPLYPLPDGFQAWFDRLTHKQHTRRYQRAIDAAWGLRKLGDPPSPKAAPGAWVQHEGGGLRARIRTRKPAASYTHQMDYMATLPEVADGADALRVDDDLNTGGLDLGFDSVMPVVPLTGQRPALPRETPIEVAPMGSWRVASDEDDTGASAATAESRLMGVGLGLLGLRQPPLVGRERERDALWQALQSVHTAQRTQVMLVRGGAGVGKGHLMRWFTERAHEVGAAHVMRATHGPINGQAHGLARMLSNALRCTGLPDDKMTKRLERILRAQGVDDPYEWTALGRILKSWDDPNVPANNRRSARFASAAERFNLIVRLLQRMGRERPMIVWLDNAQWGPDALSFVQHLLTFRDAAPVPALVVLTVRDTKANEDDPQQRTLAQITAHASTQDLTVERVDRATCIRIVQSALALTPRLAERLADQANNSPLFALQLLNDWVERDLLRPTDQGFDLLPDVDPSMPASIEDIWQRGIDRYLRGHPESAYTAFELAAILGVEVQNDELDAACRHLQLTFPWSILARMIAGGVVLQTETGWAFAHNMLREALEDRARQDGRLAALHAAVADGLAELSAGAGRGAAERRARHLILAERPTEAIDLLLQAADEALETSAYERAFTLLEEREELLEHAQIDPDQQAWSEGWFRKADIHRQCWELESANFWLEQILARASRAAWLKLIADARLLQADILTRLGRRKQAWEVNKDALAYFEWSEDAFGVASTLMHMAAVLTGQGDPTRGITLYKRALNAFVQLRDHAYEARCLQGLGFAHAQSLKGRLMRDNFRRAMDVLSGLGLRNDEALATIGMAEAQRILGHLDEAKALYSHAFEQFTSIGSRDVILAHLGFAFIALKRDRYTRAREWLDASIPMIEHSGQRVLLARTLAALLPCLAHAGQLSDCRDTLARLVELVRTTSTAHPDIAGCLEHTSDLLQNVSPTAAQQPLRLALAQWIALGQHERVANLKARLDT